LSLQAWTPTFVGDADRFVLTTKRIKTGQK
jgi:hypothetical protein